MLSITQEELKKYYIYDEETGIFTRAVKVSNANVGDVAKSLDSKGYIRISINNKRYRAHRLAWLYMTGEMPKVYIDHINGIKTDNRFCNLREATSSENQWNRFKCKDNTSGYKGVSFFKITKKWKAVSRINGVTHYLGYFVTPEEANKAYVEFTREHQGCFAVRA